MHVIVVIAMGYAGTLWFLRPHLLTMEPMVAYRTGVQILGGFCVVLLAASAFFYRRKA